MATAKDYMITAAVFGGLVLVYTQGNERDATARANMIDAYQLTAAETEAYDSCSSAISNKKLNNGGSNEEFCGCFAKQGTALLNDGHKQHAGRILSTVAIGGTPDFSSVPEESYEGLASNGMQVVAAIVSASTQCINEARTTCSATDKPCIDRAIARLNRRS